MYRSIEFVSLDPATWFCALYARKNIYISNVSPILPHPSVCTESIRSAAAACDLGYDRQIDR